MPNQENGTDRDNKFQYNHALFDSMTSFVDSVWHIDLTDEKVYVLSDYIGDNFAGKEFPLDFFRELIIRNSSTDDAKDTINYFTKEFLSGLKETFLYESCFVKDNQEHHISCNMTPDFDSEGNVKEVFVSMKDIQSQVDREEEHRRVRAELDRYLASPTWGVFQFEKDSKKILYANNTALKILGYESIEKLQGDFINGVVGTVHPSDVETVRSVVERMSAEVPIKEFECTVVHKDGKELICNSVLRYISNEFDTEVIQASLFDVTTVKNSLRLYKEATDILAGAQMGLWYFVLDDGEPRFHMDANTAGLVSAGEDLTPEEAYNYWYSRVDDDYKAQVLSSVVKMRAGIPSEVSYPYHHPVRGTITVRCGGAMDEKYTGPGIVIKGYHQDVTEFNERLLDQMEMTDAIQKHFDAVFEIDINAGTLKILSDKQNSFKMFINDGSALDKAFAPIKYAICSHSKEEFAEITDADCIISKLQKQPSVTVEVESITMGWLRITTIPSKTGKDGNIEKCIQLVENIEMIKKQEAKTRKELDDSHSNERREREMLKAISDIYDDVHIIDLAKHSMEEIKSRPETHEYVMEHRGDGVQSVIWGLAQQVLCEEHIEDNLKFLKLSDLATRMKGKNIISLEDINSSNVWCRINFIRIGSIEERLTKVIIATQNIDEEKRHMEHLRQISQTDEMTGVFNRHAYEERIKRYEIEGLGDDLWFINVDVNGLKATNDLKGHAAGDELISATAKCLKLVFAPKGSVFRMGGDEFLVTIRCEKEEMAEMAEILYSVRNSWKGQYNDSLSFSTGFACSGAIPDCTIAALERESDREMYIEKRVYHLQFDRRNQD